MNILMVGDVYGEPVRQAITKLVPRLRQEHAIDFCVVNVENAAGGFGVTAPIARQILEAGADVMTSGNHIWDKREIIEYITKENLLLRPANFPAGTPGVGYVTVKTGPHKVAVVNLMGRVFMLPIDCPFRKADEILPALRKDTPVISVDKDLALDRFISQMPNRFEPAKGPVALHGALIKVDAETGRGLSIERLRVPLSD